MRNLRLGPVENLRQLRQVLGIKDYATIKIDKIIRDPKDYHE